jgi:hypothetical protein
VSSDYKAVVMSKTLKWILLKPVSKQENFFALGSRFCSRRPGPHHESMETIIRQGPVIFDGVDAS